MTYKELLLLGAEEPLCPINTSQKVARELIEEPSRYVDGSIYPYTTEHRLSGDVYIFFDSFILLIMKALDTDCMAEMSQIERDLLDAYIEWADTNNPNDFSISLLTSLDNAINALVTCERIPQEGDCTIEYVNQYTGCPV